MAAPTPKELLAIKEFRSMVTDLELTEEQLSDMSLVQWLRARELDLKKTYDMRKASIEWRKSFDMATIKDWTPPASFPKDFEYRYIGEDNDGNPTIVVPYGMWDVRRILESGEKEKFLRYSYKAFDEFLDHMRQASKTYGKPITQFYLIVDIKNFGMRQLTSLPYVETMLELVKGFEANWPETLKASHIVNAPFIFNLMFNLIRPLLTKRTLSKIEVHGCNDKKWKPILLKTLKAEQLPVAYGGTDSFTFQCASSKSNRIDVIEADAGAEYLSAQIAPGDKFKVELDIVETNTIKWIFKTESYDIGFSVLFDEKEIVSYKRINSHVDPQYGTVLCENLGKYTLIFDNSYSRMKQKTLHYMVTNAAPIDVKED